MALTPHVRVPLYACVFALAAAGTACVDIVATGGLGFVEREEKRFALSGRAEVNLSTFDGSIEVRSWDRPEVLVEIEKKALNKEMLDDIDVRTDQNGNRVSVDVRIRPGRGHWGINRVAHLVVSVPRASDLVAATGDGSIDVARLAGRIELRSGDGSIRGSELSGDVMARTGDGSIRLDGIDGRLELGTGDGSIVASGRLTTLRARSGDGSVRIRIEQGSVVNDDWDVVTGDGSVTIDLPQAFDAELDAHTGDGRVSVGSIAISNTTESTRRTVRGRLGDGGHYFRVRSGDGSIRLGRS